MINISDNVVIFLNKWLPVTENNYVGTLNEKNKIEMDCVLKVLSWNDEDSWWVNCLSSRQFYLISDENN